VIIYLGSTRPAKVEGASEAVAAIAAIDDRFARPDIRPRDLGGVAERMPLTREAIVAAARARAVALLALRIQERAFADPEGCFAIGLEGGLTPLPGGTGDPPAYLLETCACLTDGRRWSTAFGGAIGVPAAVARDVLAGQELGDVIDRRAGSSVRGTRGAWGVLTRDLVGRKDAFRLAVIGAFAPFYNPVVFDE
jgi:non-canonical (house-cleaning) NTP pyrophosphatase